MDFKNNFIEVFLEIVSLGEDTDIELPTIKDRNRLKERIDVIQAINPLVFDDVVEVYSRCIDVGDIRDVIYYTAKKGPNVWMRFIQFLNSDVSDPTNFEKSKLDKFLAMK